MDYWLMITIGASVKRETHQHVKLLFSQEAEGLSLLGKKDWPGLACFSTFIQSLHKINSEKISSERLQLPKLSCSCCQREQTIHTNLSTLWLSLAIIKPKNSKFARRVLGPRSVQLQVLTEHQRQMFQGDDISSRFMQSQKKFFQPLLIDPSIAGDLLKHFTYSQT